MAVNKVIYDGETLMDVTDSTVTEENLLSGAVAYNAAGERIVGAVVTVPVDDVPTEDSMNAVTSGGVFAAIEDAKKWENIEGKPFEMVGGGDTVTWYGDTAGRAEIDLSDTMGIKFYKVASSVPTASELSSVSFYVNGQLMVEGEGACQLALDDGFIAGLDGVLFVIPTDNYSADIPDIGVVNAAEKGVYFAFVQAFAPYPWTLTIHGYTGFGEEKLKESALPASLAGGAFLTVTADIGEDNRVSNVSHSYNQIKAAVDAGKSVRFHLITGTTEMWLPLSKKWEFDEDGTIVYVCEFTSESVEINTSDAALVARVALAGTEIEWIDNYFESRTVMPDHISEDQLPVGYTDKVVQQVIDALPKYDGEVESA